jgi:alpha-ribazole phosphatase
VTSIAREAGRPTAAGIGGGGDVELHVWRHPRPIGAAGRCIGRTDLPIDPRRARRLADRIATTARRECLPCEIWTSPLARCADVGRLLVHRHRFVHHIDPRLAELDFGCWDGLPWCEISPAEVALWEADFAHAAPGGGESLATLAARARDFLRDRAMPSGARAVLVVGHAGWIQAASLLPGNLPCAAQWPAAVSYGSSMRLRLAPGRG